MLGEEFIKDDDVPILGDNIFTVGLQQTLKSCNQPKGGIVFAYHVNDPERYGVVEFDSQFKALSIEEKPQRPKSIMQYPVCISTTIA